MKGRSFLVRQIMSCSCVSSKIAVLTQKSQDFGTATDSAAHTIIAPYQPVNVAYRIGIRGVDGDQKET